MRIRRAFKISMVLVFISVSLFGQNEDSLRIYTLFEKAVLFLEKNEFEKSRSYAEEIIKTDDKNCSGYLLLGKIYAKYAHTKKNIERNLIYCLVIDVFEMAKKANFKCEGDANRYLKLYSHYLLDPDEIFIDIKEGEEIIIDGWVNRKTTFRYRK